ncbi:spore coat protein [Bacillus salitolerans]|uniref:Spore coat protein n=1 Tax=Bacillus salitolerans TaxID=1437434 RepID=A0ABW4LVX4_9BACI
MQQQTQGQTATGTIMPSNTMQQQMKHGGHEVFEAHEVLSGLISLSDQYLLLGQQVQDQELKSIFSRQQQFMLGEYNVMVEAFSSGQDPSKPTSQYKMNQDNDVVYGLKPSKPKKPAMATTEINDECICNMMACAVKATASQLTIASLETTNPVLRRVFADSIPNFIEMAYEIFLYQNKKHYYQVPQLAAQDMNQMIGSFTTMNQTQLQ